MRRRELKLTHTMIKLQLTVYGNRKWSTIWWPTKFRQAFSLPDEKITCMACYILIDTAIATECLHIWACFAACPCAVPYNNWVDSFLPRKKMEDAIGAAHCRQDIINYLASVPAAVMQSGLDRVCAAKLHLYCCQSTPGSSDALILLKTGTAWLRNYLSKFAWHPVKCV